MKSTFVSSLPCAMNSSGYIVTLLVVVAASSTWSASPVWTSVPVSNAVAGTPYLYHLQASDADQDALSFGAASAPPWAAVTPEPGGPVGSETITLLAGRSPSGYSGDGGPATNAQFQRPYSVAYDAAGNCYVSDAGTHRIRKIDTNGTITAFAGNGGTAYNGDGMAATNAAIWVPLGIACDTNGNVFIVSHEGNRIRKVATNGIITTIVGDGSQSSGGDGGPATSAKVNRPTDLAFDGAGNLYVVEQFGHRVRKITPGGVITRVAGTGTVGTNGAGGPATSAQLNNPYGIIAAPDGTLFISDYASHRIVKVDDNGVLTVIAGRNVAGYTGDGGPAVQALLNGPAELQLDPQGNLYVAVVSSHAVRKIDTSGIMTTIAGRPENAGYSGDGGTATNATLNFPYGIAFDPAGRLCVADHYNQRLRRIAAGTGGGRLTGTPAPGQEGTHPVALWTSDGSSVVTQRFDLVVQPPPAMVAVDSNVVYRSAQAGSNGTDAVFSVRNSGGGVLSYTNAETVAWLAVAPPSGTSTGQWNSHTVTFSSAGLTAGSYTGIIGVTATASNSPVVVTVFLTVTNPLVAPAAPMAVAASDGAYSNRVRITWEASTYAQGYRVYRHSENNSGLATTISTTTGTAFDDTNVTIGITNWYWIKATNVSGVGVFSIGDSGFPGANTIRYVAPGGGHVAPYLSWATAATNIQSAISASVDGDLILVSNGVYSTGVAYDPYDMACRVVLSNRVRVLAVNAPGHTAIVGLGPIGTSAVRGAYVGNDAVLSGFTIRDGASGESQGPMEDYPERTMGGGALIEGSGLLTNCIVVSNTAHSGGGVYGGTIRNCELRGNRAISSGGGLHSGTGYESRIVGNACDLEGGGAHSAHLYFCQVESNEAGRAGGLYAGLASHCLIVGNRAHEFSGGVAYGALISSVVIGNACDLDAGGLYGGCAYNSIIYYNEAPATPNWAKPFWASTDPDLQRCCTDPIPASRTNNITGDPGLLGRLNPRITTNSICYEAGTAISNLVAVDLDGEFRTNGLALDIGADECWPSALTGTPVAAIQASATRVLPGYELTFWSAVTGRVSGYAWSFGDGATALNRMRVTHSWSNAGSFAVVLTAWNQEQVTSVTTRVEVTTWSNNFVAKSGSHLAPFTNWTTAATNIQDAMAVVPVGGVTMVATGVYLEVGRVREGVLSRVVLDRVMTLLGSDPEHTIIVGNAPGQSNDVRCAYLEAGARLAGFTLTNGLASTRGGGVYGHSTAMVSNCLVTGNSAEYGGGICSVQVIGSRVVGNRGRYGGGACWANLKRCIVSDNGTWGYTWGGGAYYSELESCLVQGNASVSGGGIYDGRTRNCTIANNSAQIEYGGAGGWGEHYNSIIYGNTASNFPASSNYNASALYLVLNHCVVAPVSASVLASNLVVTDPHFVDPGNLDFHPAADSPCRDAGINFAWPEETLDLDGRPRVLHGVVDIGAYEMPTFMQVRVWLQGPYAPDADRMRTDLANNGIPLTSPYAADRRTVAAVPTNAVDWVLLQLRQTTNGSAVFSRSTFLRDDGYLMTEAGQVEVPVEAGTGSYYVVLKHRNHLAVLSAVATNFNSTVVTYNFTTDAGRFTGGTNGAVLLEPGAWGMRAGDADGYGEITAVDQALCSNQLGRVGYVRGDLDLDGQVTTQDLALCAAQAQQVAPFGEPETLLDPSLRLEPGRQTLLTGSNIVLSARFATGPVTWRMVDQPSGGTVSSLGPTTALYTAGALASSVDVVEAWDGSNRLDRAYLNVIGASDVAQAGKAIVIAGRKNSGDSLWPVTRYLADQSFNFLRYRGYAKENLQYLSPEPDGDADGNGQPDDVDLETTLAGTSLSITNWARHASKLFIYLVDHGGDSSGAGYFRLNASEVLTAAQLDAWLDELQDTYQTDVTVLIDCCYAGSFLDELTYGGSAKRVVMAACGSNEPTYFVAGGLVSFSDAFFAGLFVGKNVAGAWLQARDAMNTYQQAGLYESASGTTSNLYLGATFVAGKDVPTIGLVCGNQVLTGDTTANLWVDDVASVYPVDRVWALVVPPRHAPDPAHPVADLPEIELVYSDVSGRYLARFSGFSEQGTYKVLYYARDAWNSVSRPHQSYVMQIGAHEKAVLLVGGPTNTVIWTGIEAMARETYQTLRSRWLSGDDIYVLSAVTNQDLDGDGLNDVDAPASLPDLGYAITNWASATNTGLSASKLFVCLIGEGTNDGFQISTPERLDAVVLDRWMDQYQGTNHARQVNLLLDFTGAGAFLPALSGGTDRVCVASAKAGQVASRSDKGLLSFTRCFMSHVFRGETIGDAFAASRTAIRNCTGRLRQEAQLDDNGDGIANQKNVDGRVAADRYIGVVFATGAEPPEIGLVSPDQLLSGVSTVLLWAADVVSQEPVTSVWCVITPPDYNGVGELSRMNLSWNPSTRRYEAMGFGFGIPGTFACTFHAADSEGTISLPRQTLLTSSDAYEPDDGCESAAGVDIGDTFGHTMHATDDVDCVRFYAMTDYVYQVKAVQQGENGDVSLQVFYEHADGTVEDVSGVIDDYGTAFGNEELFVMDKPPYAGMYCVRVATADPEAWGVGSEYDLTVEVLIGGGHLIVVAVDKLNSTQPPPGAKLIVDNTTTQVFTGTSLALTGLGAGVHTVRVVAGAGYYAEEDPALPGQVTNANSVLYGNPKRKQVVDDKWQSVVFQFVGQGRVGTNTVVRDGWTGAWLGGAGLAFRARNGVISNLVYDGYPNAASYEAGWQSSGDGRFPGNVWLPTVNYDMTVSLAGYVSTTRVGAVTGLGPGQVVELGEVYLAPVDGNTNGLGDAWEAAYFGVGSNVNAGADADGDGVDNRSEYKAGTDPRDEGSVLKAGAAERSSNGLLLRWPVAPGRRYAVQSATDLRSGLWQNLGGPWTALVNQGEMNFTDTNAWQRTGTVYRVESSGP